jgi:hypothetical protein
MPKRNWFRFSVIITFIAMGPFLPFTGSANSQHSSNPMGSLTALIDSISQTRVAEGRFTLVSRFLDLLVIKSGSSQNLQPSRELCDFFAKLHPVARIEDSIDVAQLLELAYNSFTMIDTNAIYITVGDADTYSAWYLQRVLDIRKDIRVVSLPFLIGRDYRLALAEDTLLRGTLGISTADSLPIPPTTADTDNARQVLVQKWLLGGRRTPLFFSPTCNLEDDTHIRYLGLVFAYLESDADTAKMQGDLLKSMKTNWRWQEASRGMPEGERAIRNSMIQYLSLAMVMAPIFSQMELTSELKQFFNILQPVCARNWQFIAMQYAYCKDLPEECETYIARLERYVADHPEEEGAKMFLERLK